MAKDESKEILETLHHTTFRNEMQIKNSKTCGCFCCRKIFPAEEVVAWCDNDGQGDRTALCPYCDTDSVLGDACGRSITPSLMKAMYIKYFQ